MCGIVGIIGNFGKREYIESRIRKMLGMIRHRGPDQFGIYVNNGVGLGNARLSIIDLSSGQQPISNESETLWIVYNGEVYNYIELRRELEGKGHRFTTNTDTEVIVHLFEDYGENCLNYLNGQFSFAIWDSHKNQLFLARDRVGVRPLFYCLVNNTLYFSSEIKALLANPEIHTEIDPVSLDQIFTYWSPLSPRTIFKNIFEIPPGNYAYFNNRTFSINSYWQLSQVIPDHKPDNQQKNQYTSLESINDYVDELEELLIDSVQVRLRSDVPVGAYLSGGLDSSLTTAIIKKHTPNYLDTFSITFEDERYDEGKYQQQMAKLVGTNHQTVHITSKDIGDIFPQVIWHTETPILRTSPAPMFLLSKLVNQHQYKVVITGEGADEMFAGYDIFKEAKVRRFWADQPESTLRPQLLKRLYPYIPDFSKSQNPYLMAFFMQGLSETQNPYYSHQLRWNSTSRCKRLFSNELLNKINPQNSHHHHPDIPLEINQWDPLHKDQFLEITTFLSTYLLSSQGDRMGMANSVEGRFPFLDHRIIEYAFHLPPILKLKGLLEKYILKKLAARYLPNNIVYRFKQPYRAPIQASFIGKNQPEYILDILSTRRIKQAGLFDPDAVNILVNKAKQKPLTEIDEMALVGVISSQLIDDLFIQNYNDKTEMPKDDHIKVIAAVQ